MNELVLYDKYMGQTVKPSNYKTCICGQICKGRAALANHGRKCPKELARAAAFMDAIERGVDPNGHDL